MRSHPTDTEHRLWQILRAKRLAGWKFRRQPPIGRYRPDFVCHGAKLIVEVDGGHHCQEDDGQRDEWLRSQGFRILRFWNNDVFENEEGVLIVIPAAPLSPTPLPQGERGYFRRRTRRRDR
jgi:very-short-patch-repair endonuclease